MFWKATFTDEKITIKIKTSLWTKLDVKIVS